MSELLVPVVTFQADGLGVESSQLTLPDLSLLDLSASFTLCLWFKFFYVSGPEKAINTLLSIASRNHTNFWIFGIVYFEKSHYLPGKEFAFTCSIDEQLEPLQHRV